MTSRDILRAGLSGYIIRLELIYTEQSSFIKSSSCNSLIHSSRFIVTFLVADVIFARGKGIVWVVLPVYLIEDYYCLLPNYVLLFRETSSLVVLANESLRPERYLNLFTFVMSNSRTSLMLFPLGSSYELSPSNILFRLLGLRCNSSGLPSY